MAGQEGNNDAKQYVEEIDNNEIQKVEVGCHSVSMGPNTTYIVCLFCCVVIQPHFSSASHIQTKVFQH